MTGAGWDDDEAVLAGHRSSGVADDELAAVLGALRDAGRRAAPEPSAELAAVFAGATPMRRSRRTAQVVLGAVVVGATTFAATGVAAANDALPGPAQHLVTGVVNGITPFRIAEPAAHSPAARSAPPSAQGGAAGVVHARPTSRPAAAPSPPASPVPTGSSVPVTAPRARPTAAHGTPRHDRDDDARGRRSTPGQHRTHGHEGEHRRTRAGHERRGDAGTRHAGKASRRDDRNASGRGDRGDAHRRTQPPRHSSR
ncbi:hypothetical protein SAMN05443575_3098 [Jatrophihabitans endophyticus]|uniref:Uncharacterized protein n=1 Tax=Jatrophihabitans endophyticus TaxID=1206085 RepID=A0A1M5PJK0_9ACTN|nr:hypothetical protein [Jatrophihabitans endophyticus]SHH01679.1 hypothetical protein SAMN05443575_3098 [Jatrophihabitans endophyticus]